MLKPQEVVSLITSSWFLHFINSSLFDGDLFIKDMISFNCEILSKNLSRSFLLTYKTLIVVEYEV